LRNPSVPPGNAARPCQRDIFPERSRFNQDIISALAGQGAAY